MEVITVIEYLAVALSCFYLISALVAWVYELRKNALYQKMQRNLRVLEDMHLSAALGYAKAYKIRHDYRREIQPLERVQKFIMENLLFMTKTPGKTGKGWL